MKPLCLLLVLCIAAAPARAELRSDSPAVVANYLTAVGLGTQGWKPLEGTGDYFACSRYKNLGTAEVLPNNIAYYCEGSATKVTKIWLDLKVNVAADAPAAHLALAESAAAMCQAALGKELPAVVRTALLQGTPQTWQTGGYSLALVKHVWPTGKGYSVEFRIELAE
jgi:hypothetical protein